MAEDSPAAALARLRWLKTTPAQRAEHGRMMARTRWAQVRLLQKAEAALRASQVGTGPSVAADDGTVSHE